MCKYNTMNFYCAVNNGRVGILNCNNLSFTSTNRTRRGVGPGNGFGSFSNATKALRHKGSQRPKLSLGKADWMKELKSSKITVTLSNNVGILIVP